MLARVVAVMKSFSQTFKLLMRECLLCRQEMDLVLNIFLMHNSCLACKVGKRLYQINHTQLSSSGSPAKEANAPAWHSVPGPSRGRLKFLEGINTSGFRQKNWTYYLTLFGGQRSVMQGSTTS